MTQITKGTEQLSFIQFLIFPLTAITSQVCSQLCCCPFLHFPSFHYLCLPLCELVTPRFRLTPSSSPHRSKPMGSSLEESLCIYGNHRLDGSERRGAREMHAFLHALIHIHRPYICEGTCANMLMAGPGQRWQKSADLLLSVFIGVCDGIRWLCLESRASHHLSHYCSDHQGQRGKTGKRCLHEACINKHIHI